MLAIDKKVVSSIVLCVFCCRQILKVSAGGQHTLLLVSLLNGDVVHAVPANSANAAVGANSNVGQQAAAL